MGSIAACLSIAGALALVLIPPGSYDVFYAFAIAFLALAAAAWFTARPGLFSAAALIIWFAYVIAAPFSVTRQQFNALNRAAKSGNEQAKGLIDFYQAMEPYALAIAILVTIALLALYVWGCRRSENGAFAFLLGESEALATLSRRVGIAACILYAPLILIILYDVIQRKALDIFPNFTGTAWYAMFSSTRVQEMEWHLHAILFLLCFAYGYVRDAHVRIELVRDGMKPRTRVWIELLGCMLFLVPYCFVILEYGIEFALRSYAMGEKSAAQTGLEHRFIIKAFLPLGFTFLALAGMSVALKCLVYLFGPDWLRDRSSYYAGTGHDGAPDDAAPASN